MKAGPVIRSAVGGRGRETVAVSEGPFGTWLYYRQNMREPEAVTGEVVANLDDAVARLDACVLEHVRLGDVDEHAYREEMLYICRDSPIAERLTK